MNSSKYQLSSFVKKKIEKNTQFFHVKYKKWNKSTTECLTEAHDIFLFFFAILQPKNTNFIFFALLISSLLHYLHLKTDIVCEQTGSYSNVSIILA